MRATWLLQVLQDEGLHVVEMLGWRTRESRSGFDPQGIVLHHTATPKTADDLNVRKLLRDGRPDLSGPLCQMGLERDGTFVLVAAGRANHAGYGQPWGNDSFGVEAYNDGKGEPWAPAQMDAWVRGCAAICRYKAWDPKARIKGHREVDPNRKIDPTGVDLNEFRHDVADALTPLPAPPDAPPEEPMLYVRKKDRKDRILLTNGVYVVVGEEAEIDDRTPLLPVGEKLWTWLAKRPGLVRL